MAIKRLAALLLSLAVISIVVAQDSQRQRHPSHHGNPEVRWDVWSSWKPCSVDCGVGVTSRTRDCRSLVDGSQASGCSGKGEEIKICEITGCIRPVENMCKELSGRLIRGLRYRWELYPNPQNGCEAACRPVGQHYFHRLGKNLPDGTACSTDDKKVCVSGRCRTVGCDGLVDSEATLDACGVCGGNGTSCSSVRQTFTDDVTYGYHTFARIPRGSTNIFVSEAENSRNYLALKTADGSFRLNTDFRLSRFGDSAGAGSLVTYQRNAGVHCPDECIKIAGPTDVDVDLMVLAYTDNKGIMYSYNVPSGVQQRVIADENSSPGVYIDGGRIPSTDESIQPSSSREKYRPIFSSDFTFEKKDDVNSDVTQNGDQTTDHAETIIESGEEREGIDDGHGPVIAPETTGDSNVPANITLPESGDARDKDELKSPATGVLLEGDDNVSVDDVIYNTPAPSPYSWHVTGYTVCSATCGQGRKTSIVECVVTNKRVTVANMFCNDLDLPLTSTVPCELRPCPARWTPGKWGSCSVTCGLGVRSRDYRCERDSGTAVADHVCADKRPAREEQTCDMGSCRSGWYHSHWGNQCSNTCGEGSVQRDVVCVNHGGKMETACPSHEQPATTKTCRGEDCGHIWLTGPWSRCNATCGIGYQTRDIVCARRQEGRVVVVTDAACDVTEKPVTYMNCDGLPECEPTWYIGRWSECSQSCDEGQRSRDIRCMDSAQRPSSGCDVTRKPRERESCTRGVCPLSDQSSDNDNRNKDKGQKARPVLSTGCSDMFMQCEMVLKSTSNLCMYKYYQKICCASCKQVLNT